MKVYSQNSEQFYILDFFKGRRIAFCDFGSNNGIVLSNTHALALNGNPGICVEPSPEAFKQLQETYKDNPNIKLFNCAVNTEEGEVDFYHSGTHLHSGDVSLLSTMKKSETLRWGNTTTFDLIKVRAKTPQQIFDKAGVDKIQFLSIDIEGCEVPVLSKINLKELGVEMVCIEFNGDEKVLAEIKNYCAQFGLTNEILRNAENILITI